MATVPLPAGVNPKSRVFSRATDLSHLFFEEIALLITRIGQGFKRHCQSAGAYPSIPATTNVKRCKANGHFPVLNERCRGWLKFLHMKISLGGKDDDWSITGQPHEMWDGVTMAPMCSWQRFDLHESTYALALMADATPAWQEGYAQILEALALRYCTHWGAADFLNQFGDDPSRGKYPMIWGGVFVPLANFRKYNAPGWTGNGLGKFPNGAKCGVETDPIRAEGMLFFKGFLLLVMSIYTRVSGQRDKFLNGTWKTANVGGATSEWTLNGVAEHLRKQWSERACGLH